MSRIEQGKIRIAHDCGKASPEDMRGHDFKRGDLVSILVLGWPGRPFPPGTAGWYTNHNHAHQHWAFWTSSDIDAALIFTADEVVELVICPELAEQIGKAPAPFAITIDPALSPLPPVPPEFEVGQTIQIKPLHANNWRLPEHMKRLRGPIIERRYNDAWRVWSYKVQIGSAYTWLSNDHLRISYESYLAVAD